MKSKTTKKEKVESQKDKMKLFLQAMEKLKKSKELRIATFRKSFPAFFFYYFGWKHMKMWQLEWMWELQNGKNVLIKWFRGSRKTTIVRGFSAWCAIYQIEPFQVVQSYEDTASAEWVRQVAILVSKKAIVNDYGQLFPFEAKREEMTKKSLKDFELLNGSKIMSKSLGQTLRGANSDVGDTPQRPTMLILDDIDTDSSVKNPDTIQDNERKILGETIGALDPLRRRVLFLGNVINEDWVVPRFCDKFKNSRFWKIFSQPLITEDGVNVWHEVFTEDIVNQLEDDGEIAFNQNYKLIPYMNGQKIIKKSQILHASEWPDDSVVYIGIDPAFSLKTNSDSLAVVVTAHFGEERFIIDAFEFEWEDKNEVKVVDFVFNLYHKYNAQAINIETNNGGQIIGRALQDKELIVNFISAKKDKVERLREHEGRFTRQRVFFIEWTETLQEQLLKFPTKWVKDDLVDAMVYSMNTSGVIYSVV